MAAPTGNIIIKKIKKGGHAAHGGAWKVAYADFVTAMMAFFLLLWLLNATEAEKLAGLADYFAPTVGVKDNMGIGFRGGKGALSKGIGADKSTNKGIIFAAPTEGTVITEPVELDREDTLPVEERIEIVEQQARTEQEEDLSEEIMTIEQQLAEDNVFKEFSENISVQRTPDGLLIQVTNSDDRPMFKRGSAEVSESLKKILKKISEIVELLPNYISITGHTNSISLGKGDSYTNWELSADRANATRRYLLEAGMVPDQIYRVVGKADGNPLDPSNPEAEKNNRIDIVLMHETKITKHKTTAPDEVFIDPKAAERDELLNVKPKPKAPVIVAPVAPIAPPKSQFDDNMDDVKSGDGKVIPVPDTFFGEGQNDNLRDFLPSDAELNLIPDKPSKDDAKKQGGVEKEEVAPVPNSFKDDFEDMKVEPEGKTLDQSIPDTFFGF